MGKYSLEAFEGHPFVRLRPVMAAPDPDCCRFLELSQSELEPGSGDRLPPPELGGGRVLLRLHLDGERDILEACGFIRRVGSCYHGGRNLEAVILTAGPWSGAMLGQLAAAYAQGFDATYLLAEPGTELTDWCRKLEIPVGLLLKIDRGILPLRLDVARSGLERTWRDRPVYLEAGRTLTEEELEAAERWHATSADIPAVLGPRMTLRRLMFPRDLTAGGPMPLRMWWQNLGTAPLYREVTVVLALGDGEERFPVSISETMRPGMGDTTLNVTVKLPRVAEGTYGLWVGLKCRGAYLPLCMDAPTEDGLYRIGEVKLDHTARPYLATMWEDQYPDGYYPLEDPAQPE